MIFVMIFPAGGTRCVHVRVCVLRSSVKKSALIHDPLSSWRQVCVKYWSSFSCAKVTVHNSVHTCTVTAADYLLQALTGTLCCLRTGC